MLTISFVNKIRHWSPNFFSHYGADVLFGFSFLGLGVICVQKITVVIELMVSHMVNVL